MILISCASGNIGSALALRLKQCGAATRLAGRTAISDDPATVRLDFLDHSSFAPAVAGCDAVFLLRPPAISVMKTTLNAFIDVARRSGVGHIVFVSVAGADRNAWVPHHAVERHLQTGPKDWTILRPGFSRRI